LLLSLDLSRRFPKRLQRDCTFSEHLGIKGGLPEEILFQAVGLWFPLPWRVQRSRPNHGVSPVRFWLSAPAMALNTPYRGIRLSVRKRKSRRMVYADGNSLHYSLSRRARLSTSHFMSKSTIFRRTWTRPRAWEARRSCLRPKFPVKSPSPCLQIQKATGSGWQREKCSSFQ